MRAIIDRYRCPEGITKFEVSGELSSNSGFFHFGSNAVCYGQSSVGSPATFSTSDLPDLSDHVTSKGSTVILPFNPSQIVDNLRLERYALNGYAGKKIISSNDAIRNIYYASSTTVEYFCAQTSSEAVPSKVEGLTFPFMACRPDRGEHTWRACCCYP